MSCGEVTLLIDILTVICMYQEEPLSLRSSEKDVIGWMLASHASFNQTWVNRGSISKFVEETNSESDI